MKKTNRIMSILLTVVMVVCMLPVSVFAADTTKYWVTVTESPFDGSGGTVSGEGQYAPGEQVTISIAPNTDGDYCAAQWGLADIGEGIISAIEQKTSHTFTMPEKAVQISITFTQHSYITYSDLKNGTHQNKCFYCGVANGVPEKHIDAHGGGDGTTPPDGYCDLCSAELHTHSYSSEWSSDEEGHWHECDCGDMPDFADHTPGAAATTTTPQTCTICGYEIAPVLTDYTLTLDYSIVTESGVEIGAGLSDQNVGCPAGDVVDLSGYWRDDSLEVTGSDGKTYYFGGFVENSNGNGILLYSATMNSNKTLYANWVLDKQITVILDTEGGVLPYRKTRIAEIYADISTMNSLHKPVRAGYDFVGWSVEDDGVADSGDTYISDGWPIYAVWQTYMPSYDDNWDPPAPGTPVEIGGDYDAVRISDGVIGKIIDNGNEVVVKFPDGTSGTLTDFALIAAKDNLQDGESLQIAIKNAGSEVLPKTLTEQGPYGGSEAAIDKSIFKATGIENIEDRLKTLGLINGNTDSSVTEDEFEYLYHYLTTDELTALKKELNESAHFEHHQNAVAWLDKMIERDGAQVALNTGHLDESGIRSKLEAVGYTGNGLPLGLLRQADLDMEQLEYIKNLMQEFIEVFDDDADELILAWANEAIARKELEQENATITPMTRYGLEEYAELTEKQMQKLTDMGLQNLDNPSVGQIKKLNLTLEQMELLYAEIDRARSAEYNPAYQAEYDILLNWLEKAITEKEQENTDTPTYINVSGTSDGINPIFIGAVDVNIGAVKVDGTTTPIAIKADRSDAVAWSTNIDSAWLEEKLAEMKNATGTNAAVRAYKVLENGTLEAKEIEVKQNTDGTLILLSALSNGNSTYVFLLEPVKADVDDTPTAPDTDWDYWYRLMLMMNQTFDITASGTEGGTISPAGVSRVKCGNSLTYTIIPAEGYEIVSVTVDGKVVGAVTEYTFKNVRAKHSIHAEFQKTVVTPDPIVNPFKDIFESDWYYDDVMYVYANDLMNGTDTELFSPESPTTRAMIVTILWRLEGRTRCNYLMQFEDVPEGEWYSEAIRWAASEKIVEGYGNDKFGTNDPITREQMATILYRYIQKKGGGFVGMWAFPLRYDDASEVSEWAYEPLCWMTMKGIMQGDQGKLTPKNSAKRSEVAAILHRFMESMDE